ncbi:MAG TPA: SDR family NAD(P)-dependent oxidoreductase [Oligoflexia bacterium]|nr:SDR family NAD(P)-dependent oxidoreductase [Oligoflexia bacterium]
MSKSKSIFVTGGTGFIGSAIVRRLVREGHRVKVLDDDSRGNVSRLEDIKGQFEFVRGDVRDGASVLAASKGADSVFHLAFVNGTEFFYSKPELVLDVGVKGMVHVLDACIKNNIPELVLASSSEVYQVPPTVPTDESAPLVIPDVHNPRYSYAGGKLISELMAINYGRKFFERVLIFRPHNVYGPNMGWEHVLPQFIMRFKKLLKEHEASSEPIPFQIQGTGRETRAFNFIDDFVDGIVTMHDKGKHLEIYHIGTEEEISIRDVAKAVGGFFGKEINIIEGPLQKGGTPRRCPNISKMRALGYAPRFSFREGLPLIARWYDANYKLEGEK